jgi:hypothetical protein
VVLHLPEDLRALASDRLSNRLRGLGRLMGREGRISIERAVAGRVPKIVPAARALRERSRDPRTTKRGDMWN